MIARRCVIEKHGAGLGHALTGGKIGRVEEADRVKTDFVANMSYELRTPLTSIGGFAELLGGGYAGDLSTKGSDYVGAILESVDRLSKLINDVLDLTTGEARGAPLEKERVDIAGLCRAKVVQNTYR